MNGEVSDLAQIVVSARKALRTQNEIRFHQTPYVDSVEFYFLNDGYVAESVQSWFDHCKEEGVVEIKLLLPGKADDRGLLGFVNTKRGLILCFHESGMVSYFNATWEFSQDRRLWHIKYQEFLWENPPKGMPEFVDNTENFKKVLLEIADLAHTIKETPFERIFKKAYDTLSEKEELLQGPYLPDIPSPFRNLYAAASSADVFGAMGSWNDSPPYEAEEKGLKEDYDRLSDELLKQMHLAILYAVNEF